MKIEIIVEEVDKICSFRINKRFRAICVYQGGILKVSKVDNHQN